MILGKFINYEIFSARRSSTEVKSLGHDRNSTIDAGQRSTAPKGLFTFFASWGVSKEKQEAFGLCKL